MAFIPAGLVLTGLQRKQAEEETGGQEPGNSGQPPLAQFTLWGRRLNFLSIYLLIFIISAGNMCTTPSERRPSAAVNVRPGYFILKSTRKSLPSPRGASESAGDLWVREERTPPLL